MIELQCKSCNKTFERRGAKRGGHPDCNECRETKERNRSTKQRVASPSKLQRDRSGDVLRRELISKQGTIRAYMQQM